MLARSARHAAQAQGLLDDLARLDLALVGDPPAIAALQTLGRERQANVLRHWLRLHAAVTGGLSLAAMSLISLCLLQDDFAQHDGVGGGYTQ